MFKHNELGRGSLNEIFLCDISIVKNLCHCEREDGGGERGGGVCYGQGEKSCVGGHTRLHLPCAHAQTIQQFRTRQLSLFLMRRNLASNNYQFCVELENSAN